MKKSLGDELKKLSRDVSRYHEGAKYAALTAPDSRAIRLLMWGGRLSLARFAGVDDPFARGVVDCLVATMAAERGAAAFKAGSIFKGEVHVVPNAPCSGPCPSSGASARDVVDLAPLDGMRKQEGDLEWVACCGIWWSDKADELKPGHGATALGASEPHCGCCHRPLVFAGLPVGAREAPQ